MLIKTITLFTFILLNTTLNASSADGEIDLAEKRPFIYQLTHEDGTTFSLLGTDHEYNYGFIDPTYKDLIENHDILAPETYYDPNDTIKNEESILEEVRKLYPRRNVDDLSFQILYNNDLYQHYVSKKNQERLKSYAQESQVSFGITLTFFSYIVLDIDLINAGMDFQIEKAFEEENGKSIIPLISIKRQMSALSDSNKLILEQENTFEQIESLIGEFLLPSLPLERDDYPISLENIYEEVANERASRASVCNRDEEFSTRALEITRENPGKNILIMVGYMHLPYMINRFTNQGFTAEQQ